MLLYQIETLENNGKYDNVVLLWEEIIRLRQQNRRSIVLNTYFIGTFKHAKNGGNSRVNLHISSASFSNYQLMTNLVSSIPPPMTPCTLLPPSARI